MLRNYWYIACASLKLGKTPKAVRVLDQDLVVFRKEDGAPAALLDRCCHRGVKLSLGKVNGCDIACGYHGWQFNEKGECTHIPSLTKDRRIPNGIGVPAFPCIEQNDYIWVWMGEGEPNPATPLEIDGWATSSWKQGVITYECDLVRLVENQFDCCHPAFVHEDTHPAYFVANAVGLREVELETRLTDNGLVFFTPAVKEDEDIPSNPFSKIELELPNRVWVKQKMGPLTFISVLHFVPLDAYRTRMEFAMRVNSKKREILWTDDEGGINQQDRIVESGLQWYDDAESFERSVEADYPTLLIRQIYGLLAKGSWEEKREKLTKRRVIRVRT
jgi:nitrite reductase/ring-hydroxylating ferredoxin subunit